MKHMNRKRISKLIVICLTANVLIMKTGITGVYAESIEAETESSISVDDTNEKPAEEKPAEEQPEEKDISEENREEVSGNSPEDNAPEDGGNEENKEAVSKNAVSENTVSENTVSDNQTVSGNENGEDIRPEGVMSIEMPAAPEGRSSFDFILDPDGLIEKTDAKRYGGREFQKGAAFFFINNSETEDGTAKNSFSDTSDRRTIVNRSSIPVKVSIQVSFNQATPEDGEIKISSDPLFEGVDGPALAFSLTDGTGQQIRMDEDGQMSCEAVIEKEDEYTFFIKGDVNKNADWSGVKDGFLLNVSWSVSRAGEESVSDNETDGQVLSGSETGQGILEGIAENGPCSVILPAAHEDMYSFIMDPQGLIEASSAAAHPGKSFESGKTLYFRNTEKDAAFDFSSKSDSMVITNNGPVPLKVSVSVSIASEEKYRLSPVEDFEGYKDSQIYISVVSGNGAKLDNITYLSDGVSVNAAIPPADAEVFDTDWNEERGYYRVPVSKEQEEETDLPEFSFRITGATNEKASWRKLKKSKVKLNVVWSVEEAE